MKSPSLLTLTAILGLPLASCFEQEAAVDVESPPAPASETLPASTSIKSGADVDTAAYRKIISEDSRLVIVDFHADWCGPCKILAPSLEKVAQAHSENVLLIKINVDDNQKLASEIGIQSIPFVQFYRGGKVVDQFVGVVPEERIEELVQTHTTGG